MFRVEQNEVRLEWMPVTRVFFFHKQRVHSLCSLYGLHKVLIDLLELNSLSAPHSNLRDNEQCVRLPLLKLEVGEATREVEPRVPDSESLGNYVQVVVACLVELGGEYDTAHLITSGYHRCLALARERLEALLQLLVALQLAH